MNSKTIINIIDAHLDKWANIGLNKLPVKIDIEMADPNQDSNEEWRKWHPIISKVTDEQISEFEDQLGFLLPPDYKVFLKHKHFYDLQISEVSFCRHSVNNWKNELSKMIFNGYPAEFLIEKGYMPFADWSDWGLLCFDTNRNRDSNNYPVVLWDHEIINSVKDMYKDFYEMIIKIDEEEKQN